MEYTVQLARKAEHPLVEGDEGECDFGRGLITLLDNPEHPTRVVDAAIHEYTHAVWDGSGITTLLRTTLKGKLSVAKIRDLEEQIIRMQTPGLIGAMRSSGLLSKRKKMT